MSPTPIDPVLDPWGAARAAAASIATHTGVVRHDVAVVLGSGWMPAADRIGDLVADVPFAQVGGFPHATVVGHAGVVRSVSVAGGRHALIVMGRVHGYEGHEPNQVVHAVRTAVLAGCSVIVLTNAAGGMRDGMRVGDPVLISDHLNLTGKSPLTGPPSPPELGPRFVDLTECWSRRLRDLARTVDPTLAEGVYAGVNGPQYETPAEIAMFRAMGADLVGMSTVLEAIAAAHLGAEVMGISLVTNLAAGITGERLDHSEVVAAGAAAAERMGDLLAAMVDRL